MDSECVSSERNEIKNIEFKIKGKIGTINANAYDHQAGDDSEKHIHDDFPWQSTSMINRMLIRDDKLDELSSMIKTAKFFATEKNKIQRKCANNGWT